MCDIFEHFALRATLFDELVLDWTITWLNYYLTEVWLHGTVTWLNCDVTELILAWAITLLNFDLTELWLDWTNTWLNQYLTGLRLDWTNLTELWREFPKELSKALMPLGSSRLHGPQLFESLSVTEVTMSAMAVVLLGLVSHAAGHGILTVPHSKNNGFPGSYALDRSDYYTTASWWLDRAYFGTPKVKPWTQPGNFSWSLGRKFHLNFGFLGEGKCVHQTYEILVLDEWKLGMSC